MGVFFVANTAWRMLSFGLLGKVVVQVVFVSILLNLFNRKQLLKIGKITSN